MAYQQSDLDKIEAAIASGVLRVKFADREVEYQSISALKDARDLIRKELGITKQGSGRRLASFSKGTD